MIERIKIKMNIPLTILIGNVIEVSTRYSQPTRESVVVNFNAGHRRNFYCRMKNSEFTAQQAAKDKS